MRDYVSTNSLDNKIFFLPPVPLEQLVQQAIGFDVGIILAKPDTANGRMCTGFKFFEYINSGLAILAPSSPPLIRLTQSYGCGLTYGWPSPDSISHQIKILRNNNDALQRMKNASLQAAKFFNAEIQSAALHSLITHESI